jgi:hypothetical protein
MAAGIQRTMLPPNDQKFERVELRWQFHPCVELADETLNIIPLDDHHIALYVIDVSGHGDSSALLAVTLNRWLSSLPGMYGVFPRHGWDPMHFDIASPAAVARRLNQQFPMTPANTPVLHHGVRHSRSAHRRVQIRVCRAPGPYSNSKIRERGLPGEPGLSHRTSS